MPALRDVFLEAISYADITILEGARPKELQDKYFDEGKTTKRWPDSNHNIITPEEARELGILPRPLSRAVDCAPYRWSPRSVQPRAIDWKNERQWFYMAGLLKGLAIKHGVKLRWGGNWRSDNDFTKKKKGLIDFPHFERIGTINQNKEELWA